jgi:hypothetical protein
MPFSFLPSRRTVHEPAASEIARKESPIALRRVQLVSLFNNYPNNYHLPAVVEVAFGAQNIKTRPINTTLSITTPVHGPTWDFAIFATVIEVRGAGLEICGVNASSG